MALESQCQARNEICRSIHETKNNIILSRSITGMEHPQYTLTVIPASWTSNFTIPPLGAPWKATQFYSIYVS